MATDPYTTLGITRGATEADVKKAYRKLAKALHPDTNRDNPSASERFAKVSQAYELLSDKDKRARFDRGEIDGDGNPSFAGFGSGGAGGGNPFGGGFQGQPGGFSAEGVDLGGIFDGLFGGRGRGQPGGAGAGPGGFSGFGRGPAPSKGANVNYRLMVPFEDAATVKPQRITLQDGKTIDVKLPMGVEDGVQMRLAGKGNPGPGGAGDAIITLGVSRHKFFTRDGDHIRLDLPISLVEAVNGAKVKVPTVDGAVMLNIAAGANSGQTLRLKGKGFTGKNGTRGDQLVTLMIDLPKGDDTLRIFAEGWRDERPLRSGLGV
jgi:DnaJ-class molecular chaperone